MVLDTVPMQRYCCCCYQVVGTILKTVVFPNCIGVTAGAVLAATSYGWHHIQMANYCLQSLHKKPALSICKVS
jgi:hypothetical protein